MTSFVKQNEPPAPVVLHEGRLYVNFERFNDQVNWEALRKQLTTIGLELVAYMDDFAQAMERLIREHQVFTLNARQCGATLRKESMMVARIRKLDRTDPKQPDWARRNQAPRSYRKGRR